MDFLRGGARLLGACWLLLCAAGLLPVRSADAGFYDQDHEKKSSCTSQNLDQVELKTIFQDIAKELCTDNCGECGRQNQCGGAPDGKGAGADPQKAVLVADFVDLQNLQPNQYGMVMGELMRGSLNNSCCYKIVQAEFAKYFKLTESGLVVLSRNVSDIKTDKYVQPECIVGTYTMMNSKMIIFVRKINTSNGLISKMVMREIDFECSGGKVSYTVK